MFVRLAVPEDADEIAAVKGVVWEAEDSDITLIARALREPNHCAVVAVRDNRIVGFVDGFLTLAPDRVRRWEVDLVAVLPSARGLGVARAMIADSTALGREMGATLARALVHVENTPSQRAFAACGYERNPQVYTLLVCSVGGIRKTPVVPAQTYLLSVTTFGYQGIWLEGTLTAQSFVAAQDLRKKYGWDVAGAVLPEHHPALGAAQNIGFTRVGAYQWWQITL